MIPIYKPNLRFSDALYLLFEYCSKRISGNTSTISKVEDKIAKFLGEQSFVLVSNGTVALSAVLKTLNLRKGSKVLVPDFSYVAAAHAIVEAGLRPVFVDVDLIYWQMDFMDFMKKIKGAKAVIFVNNYGLVPNYDKFFVECEKRSIPTVVDCAESFGVSNQLTKLIPDFKTFSFFANKNITCGEGGGVVAKSASHIETIKKIRSHGLVNREKIIHDMFGSNYRLNSISAKLLERQLKIFRINMVKKQKIYKRYLDAFLSSSQVSFQKSPKGCNPIAPWLVVLKFKDKSLLGEVESSLISSKIEIRHGWYSSSMMSHMKHLPKNNGNFLLNGNSKTLSKTTICLPSYPTLSKKAQSLIIRTIKKAIQEF